MIVNKYNKGGGSPFDPTQYYTKSQVDAEISGATEGLSSEEYVDEQISAVTDMMESKEEVIASALTQLENSILEISGDTPDLSNYYTKAETDAEITAATSPIQEQLDDVERVTATALTELHNDILEISGSTPDLSNYYTKAETDAEITGATQGFITSAYTGFTKTEDFDDLVESLEGKEEVVAAALVDLDERVEERVESQDVKHIVKLTQSAYDALATKDPGTFYIIVE